MSCRIYIISSRNAVDPTTGLGLEALSKLLCFYGPYRIITRIRSHEN